MALEYAKTFQELIVWQKAHYLVLDIYKLTAEFPKSEVFGLTSQMRRSSVSIAANIAEGFGKKGKPDKARFFNIAQGSLEETNYYLILAQDLGYGNTETLQDKLNQVRKLLIAYSKKILTP
ncbi:MAG: four helix bundle protein [Bacteroidia bacterium]